jgi:ATP synthase protein I
MQAEDVRALRQSAVPTAAAGVLCGAVGAAVSGGKGVLGAAVALLVVSAFFLISTLVIARAARMSPQTMMIAAIATYTVKILVLAVLSARFKDTTLFSGRVFGLTAIICVLIWCAGQIRAFVTAKTLIVEPSSAHSAGGKP